jgi:transcriptional regulator with XRE-family HTH domain
MDIGEKIKNARITKGMTQEELGKLLGVQKSAIAKYESGRVVNIKRSTLKKISDILEIRPSELIYEVYTEEEYKEMQQKNSTLADITVRMRTDSEFFNLIEGINQLNPEQLASLKPIVDVLLLKG